MTGHWQDIFSKEHNILMEIDTKLASKFAKLCEVIQNHKSALVAFSGGTDSALLAFLGNKLLDRCLCITADSPTISKKELSDASAFASLHNLEFRIIQRNELDNQLFCVNDTERCFYCKDDLLKLLAGLMNKENLEAIFDGSNFDDLGDFRPGRRAVELNNAESPLMEAKLGKPDIRLISKSLGLSTWEKPQMACLASRFPYGTGIDEDKLASIEKAEGLVRNLGYRDVRIRYHGDIARIELGKDEQIDLNELRKLVPDIKKLGFKYIALDMEGYRTGSLNE